MLSVDIDSPSEPPELHVHADAREAPLVGIGFTGPGPGQQPLTTTQDIPSPTHQVVLCTAGVVGLEAARQEDNVSFDDMHVPFCEWANPPQEEKFSVPFYSGYLNLYNYTSPSTGDCYGDSFAIDEGLYSTPAIPPSAQGTSHFIRISYFHSRSWIDPRRASVSITGGPTARQDHRGEHYKELVLLEKTFDVANLRRSIGLDFLHQTTTFSHTLAAAVCITSASNLEVVNTQGVFQTDIIPRPHTAQNLSLDDTPPSSQALRPHLHFAIAVKTSSLAHNHQLALFTIFSPSIFPSHILAHNGPNTRPHIQADSHPQAHPHPDTHPHPHARACLHHTPHKTPLLQAPRRRPPRRTRARARACYRTLL
ncbi:hypothetical protein EVG20_g10921 [Dentipellis fragilis]|uniref:Uncharacterized protein n=1 Tax=Dentipellis fragilis TaxID=205917 RepID=A0A4Y9XPD0_9AGAM|nr:hypothetical protein EVG20_g10921 [Dentipellis fragilis]